MCLQIQHTKMWINLQPIDTNLSIDSFWKSKPINKLLLDEVFVIYRIIKVKVGDISPSWRLITFTETLIVLDNTKTKSNNFFIIHWTQKLGSHVSASSLMASNMNPTKLTWLPLETILCGHTWHDNCIMYRYDITGADFENSVYALGQSEKS